MARLRLLRDINRTREIAGVLLKYGFGEVLERLDLPKAWAARLTPPIHGRYSRAERARLAAEELGPVFIKAAQILSTRPDLLPPDFIEEFRHLRDRVKPLPFTEMLPVLEEELGGRIEDFLDDFEETPQASGSLAQIYRARLKDSGRRVAVKVQRPRLKKPVQTDFEIMAFFAERMHKNLPGMRPFDLPVAVQQLKQGVLNELDFANEARNAELFNSLNRYPEHVYAPEVIDRFTSHRLLVTEWVDGVPVGEGQVIPELGRRLAQAGGESFFSQIMNSGFFHGDPHPGNIFVTVDGRLCFLDWGLAGQLTRQMRYNLVDLFAACRDRSPERVTRIALRMGRGNRRLNRVGLEKAVTAVLFKHDEALREMRELGRVIFELIYVFGSHGIHVARDYTLLAKAVISIEESARTLDPDFQLAALGEPFVRELNWERWNPLKLTRWTVGDLREKVNRLTELPEDVQRLLHQLEDHELSVALDHRGLGSFGDKIDAAFSRLSLAVLSAALIMGSSIVLNVDVGPRYRDIPLLSYGGYLLSVIMGVYLIIDILRHRSRSR